MRWTCCALAVAVLLALAAEAAAECQPGQININPLGGLDCKRCRQKEQCDADECWASCDEPNSGNCVACPRPRNAQCMDDGRQECAWSCSPGFVKISLDQESICAKEVPLVPFQRHFTHAPPRNLRLIRTS